MQGKYSLPSHREELLVLQNIKCYFVYCICFFFNFQLIMHIFIAFVFIGFSPIDVDLARNPEQGLEVLKRPASLLTIETRGKVWLKF